MEPPLKRPSCLPGFPTQPRAPINHRHLSSNSAASVSHQHSSLLFNLLGSLSNGQRTHQANKPTRTHITNLLFASSIHLLQTNPTTNKSPHKPTLPITMASVAKPTTCCGKGGESCVCGKLKSSPIPIAQNSWQLTFVPLGDQPRRLPAPAAQSPLFSAPVTRLPPRTLSPLRALRAHAALGRLAPALATSRARLVATRATRSTSLPRNRDFAKIRHGHMDYTKWSD